MDEPPKNLKILDPERETSAVGDSSTNSGPPHSPLTFSGEVATITGTLASMTHEQAFSLIEKAGGTGSAHLSRQTTLLIIGEEGWPLEEDGRLSVKLLQAQTLIEEGFPLRIVTEAELLQGLELNQETQEVHRLYTPAMLSTLLKIPVHVIRSWERAGLIRAEKKIYRLPYFTYQEVTTARKVSELLQSGLTVSELKRSLRKIGQYLPQSARIIQQLELHSHHHQLVVRDQHGFIDPQTRQRLFDFQRTSQVAGPDQETEEDEDSLSGRLLRFDSPKVTQKSATDWMVEGCRMAEIADTTEAIRCFRKALRIRPNDVEAHFYLADSLYRLGKHEAALERYLAAIEHDPEYLEAWNQIGCVYAEMNKWNEALDAFDAALKLYPDFAETHLQKAETLYLMQKIPTAIKHWRKYLELDQQGPWAELVCQRLEQHDAEYSAAE